MRRWLWRWRLPLWVSGVSAFALADGDVHPVTFGCIALACVVLMVGAVINDDLNEANDDLIDALREQNRELRRSVRLLETEARQLRRVWSMAAEHQRRRRPS